MSTRPFDFAQDRLEAASARRHGIGMSGKDKEKEERLAAALRENLRKRKAQSRELKDGEREPDA
jgi:hypothetical protein